MYSLILSLSLSEKTQSLFSEIALNSLLQLLKKEVSDHSRHLQQYFQVFLNYANRGPIEVSVLHVFILVIPLPRISFFFLGGGGGGGGGGGIDIYISHNAISKCFGQEIQYWKLGNPPDPPSGYSSAKLHFCPHLKNETLTVCIPQLMQP